MGRKVQIRSPLQRIAVIMNYYYRRGTNRESVNSVYKNILKTKFSKEDEK